MSTITISVEDDVETVFRSTASKEYGGKKGFLGDAITEAMRDWLSKREQNKIAEKEIARMRKGYQMGGFRFKNRGELHERR